MNLLAFELSTEACSVAVWADGTARERHEIAPRRHADLALTWAQGLLDEAGLVKSQLDAIAVGRGPGAFTGVRLGISIAQGIALALDRPVLPVSTLAALAMAAHDLPGGDDPRLVLAAIDARMGEIYFGAFELSGEDARALGDERVLSPAQAEPPDDSARSSAGWYGVGTGFAAAEGVLRQRLQSRLIAVDAQALPHASCVARLAAAAWARGEALAPERLEPAYLRNRVALTLAEQQAARGT